MLHLNRGAAVFALALPFVVRGSELDPTPIIAPATPAEPAMDTSSVTQPVERAFLATHPLFQYQYTYAEGVLSSPGQSQNTSIQTASVGLHWNLGSDLTFHYTPTWTFYSNRAFRNIVGHDAGVVAEGALDQWNVRGSYQYLKEATPLVETGQQTNQETNTAMVQTQRALTPDTTLELGLEQYLRSAKGFSTYRDWSTEDWLHHALTPVTSVSLGGAYGRVSVTNSPDMQYEQLNGRVRWQPTDKIRADLRGGLEWREFLHSTSPNARTPIYGATVMYRPFETTSISLLGDRVVSPSYFPGQIDRSSSWQVQLSQRLLGRVMMDLSYIHRTASYSADVASVITTRHDDGDGIRLNLGTSFRERGSIAAFYEYRRNRSSQADFGFGGSQFGFTVSYHY